MHHARNGFLTAKGLEEAAQREHRRTVSLEMGLLSGSRCERDASASLRGRGGLLTGLLDIRMNHHHS